MHIICCLPKSKMFSRCRGTFECAFFEWNIRPALFQPLEAFEASPVRASLRVPQVQNCADGAGPLPRALVGATFREERQAEPCCFPLAPLWRCFSTGALFGSCLCGAQLRIQ